MPRKIKEKPVVVDEVLPVAEIVEEADLQPMSVDVYCNSEFIRTYSLKDHGDDFLDLAMQFVKKNGAGYHLK